MSNTYFVAGIPFSDELYHHGIKGQKWGQRRFQNPDGTLTAEGRVRYNEGGSSSGNSSSSQGKKRGIFAQAYRDTLVGDYRDSHGRSTGMGRRFEPTRRSRDSKERRAEKLEKKSEKYSKSSEKYKTLSGKAKAQRQANADFDRYVENASTKKLMLQNTLFGMRNAQNYRQARARGATRVQAFFQGNNGSIIAGTLRKRANIKKYGYNVL